MPRSLWVIEVLQPKVRGEGREWTPITFEQTRREARLSAEVHGCVRGCVEHPVRVRRWAPAEGR
jgi:hypothetical protein